MKHIARFLSVLLALLVLQAAVIVGHASADEHGLITGEVGDVIVFYDEDVPRGSVCTITYEDNDSSHGNIARSSSGDSTVVTEDFERGLMDSTTHEIVSNGRVTAEVELTESEFSEFSPGTSTSVAVTCEEPPCPIADSSVTGECAHDCVESGTCSTTTTTVPTTTTSTPETTVPPTTTTVAPPPDDPCPDDGLACTGSGDVVGLLAAIGAVVFLIGALAWLWANEL